jgi:LysM repeat protein
VKSGETISEIADRYGISSERLLALNGIRDPKGLQVGSRITVPTAGPAKPSQPAGGGGSASPASRGPGNYTVKSGETISEIADRYGISSERLLALNGIRDPKGLQVGSRITVPTAGPAKPSQPAGRGGLASPASRGPANYTVKSGETISEIADRYGISSESLLALNGIRDPKGLQVGSRITVPTAGPAKPAKPPVLPAITSAQGKALSHTVRPGDTLSDIANTYGVPIERIAALNGLKDPDNLVPDTQLKLRNPPPAPKPAAKPASRPPAKVASKPAAKPASKPASKPAAATVASSPASTPASTTPTPGTTPVAAPQATTKPAETTPSPAITKPAAEKPGSAKPAATKPVVTTPAVTKPAPTKPVVTQPVVTKPVVAKPVVEKPAVSPVQAVKPDPSPQGETAQKPETTVRQEPAETAEVKPEPKPAVKAEVTPKAETTKPAKTEVATGKPAKPDWRSFGPLQVDWANWQPMGGSFVAPGLNATGQSFYLAVNCSAKRINATGPSGAWKTWDLPSTDYEQQLVKDLCREKGG